MKLSPRNRLILTIALAVVVALAVGAFLVYPKFGQLSDLDSQISQAQSDIDQAKALLEQRQAIKGQAAETDAALLRLANELPESPELASLIIELQDTANEAGVEFRTLTPDAPVQNTGFASIKMKMEVLGGWADTIDFMQRVRKLTRQVRIVGYSAQPYTPATGEAQNEAQQVTFTMDLEVYTLAAAQTASGAAPAPAPATAQ
jgi:Tfp pilus assembly protein PilO